ncbi:SGNH hydrolase domain-containing protein [Arthrobacter jiangjiafuii]|uniref:SGNH hydrolase domain-containing protein n=1 Tax=Arthrobacter jiangjiafuii TaxID=2817475 RepID=UPI003B58914E
MISAFLLSLIPGPTQISADWGELESACSGEDEPGSAVLDGHCRVTAPDNPARTILVIGDSHAQQWLGAVEPMAGESNYKVVSLLMGACSFGIESEGRSQGCNDFNAAAMAYALEHDVDAVITVASAASKDSTEERIVDGLPAAARELTRHGIVVVGVRDNPRYPFNMYACSQSEGASACATDRSLKLASEAPFNWPGGVPDGVGFVDMSDLICPAGVCPPVIGNVNVYMDTNHLTATYAGSMSDEFSARFHAVSGW